MESAAPVARSSFCGCPGTWVDGGESASDFIGVVCAVKRKVSAKDALSRVFGRVTVIPWRIRS